MEKVNKTGHLVFVGDSFCASFQGSKFLKFVGAAHKMHGQIATRYPTYLDLATKWSKRKIFFSFGYAGRSWWFSRHEFLQTINKSPVFYQGIDAIIFCHTVADRLNTTDPRFSTALLYDTSDKTSPDYHPELCAPYRAWVTELFDDDFQLWAQQQWFKEINELFGNIPMIHFNIAKFSVEDSLALKGVVYTTPLLNISMGELYGTDEEVMNQVSNDQRYNHFNEHNNHSMARLIVDTLDNYKPGNRPIDLIKYEFDQPNPNAWRWPESGYGSK